MARPRQDGTPARAVNRRKLTDLFVSSRKAQERAELIWDVKQPGLALSVRTTGKKAWKVIYRFHGRPRWLHLGDVRSIGLADARRADGGDHARRDQGQRPGSRAQGETPTGTFAELASEYVELHARKHNKSWKQAEALVTKHLIPRWGKLKANAITRSDVRLMMARIDAPMIANLVLANASAIFSWAIRQEILTVNPCKLVDRNPTTDRERVLSDDEVRLLWAEARPGAEIDPAHRSAPGRGRRHAARAHRRRLVADAGQAGRVIGRGPRTPEITACGYRSPRRR